MPQPHDERLLDSAADLASFRLPSAGCLARVHARARGIALAGVLVSIFMVRGWDLRPQEMPVSEPGFEAREAA
jgi:hypothetical protein